MNRKSKQVLSASQQNKLQQLHLEIEALEKQIDTVSKKQEQLTADRNSSIYLSDRFAKTGIRLADVEG